MTEIKKVDGKQRIFDAAVLLFATKGYDAIGVRELADSADVNISMVNYYYGGKIGVLKAIIDEACRRYYAAIMKAGPDDMDPVKRMRTTIHNLVQFFRDNAAMAIVMTNTFSYEIPEVVDLKVQWVAQNRERLDKQFSALGLDTKDAVQMTVFRGLVTGIILQHFQSKFIYERNRKMYDDAEKKYFCGQSTECQQECNVEYDDKFYSDYADVLADFYLFGATGVAEEQNKKKGD